MPPNPQGPSFSERQKRKQKIVQGDCCPLENPLLGSALAASPGPTAGFLSGNSRCSESALAFLPGCSFRSQRYIRYAPRVRVCAGWYALTVPGAAQRCGTSFQRLVCVDPPVRKCLRISERVRAVGAHRSRKLQNLCAVRTGGKSVPW